MMAEINWQYLANIAFFLSLKMADGRPKMEIKAMSYLNVCHDVVEATLESG